LVGNGDRGCSGCDKRSSRARLIAHNGCKYIS
jgi:hypothetical protein